MKFQDKKLEVSYSAVVTLRVLLSLIFLVAGTSHLIDINKTVSRIESANLGFITITI
ncbi:hypothetical protein [Mongoliibacter ruber]|uniref:Uncharacterized protein n=1 Tax=Mongoliibacter ruber TaxID=1750599 RepID=A0A2T0WBK2_9BACT|nr:hypothetical protein [Mongoliibacter ruber]PRY84083.1 hypothetical protein CLW00_12321 [Mongoliibacter ruber]